MAKTNSKQGPESALLDVRPPAADGPRAVVRCPSPVRRILLNADGSWLTAGSADGSIRIGEAGVGGWRFVLTGHTGPIESLALDDSGVLLASSSADHTIRIWEAQTGRCRCILRGGAFPSTAVAFSPDGERIASGDSDGVIRIWDVHPPRVRTVCSGTSGAVIGLAFSPDASRLFSAGEDGLFRIWRISDSAPIALLDAHCGAATAWACARDRSMIATGGIDGRARLWDTRAGRCVQTIVIGSKPIGAVALLQEPSLLAAVDRGGWIQAHSIGRTGGPLPVSARSHPVRAGASVGAAIFAGGTALAIGGPDRGVRFWTI